MGTIKRKFHWSALIILVVVLLISTYLCYNYLYLDYQFAIEDAVFSTVLLIISTWSIVLIIRSYPTTAVLYVFAVGTGIFIGLLAMGVNRLFFQFFLGVNGSPYQSTINNTFAIRFLFTLIINCWVATNSAMQKTISISEGRFKHHTDVSALLKEAELYKLRQQLQPHFLYNCLNSISALIFVNPDNAQTMIGKLSDFLRSSVKRETEDKISIEDELNYLQSYLDIEKVRFGARLHVLIEKEFPGIPLMPPFLLQPIIENAIKFGLYGNTGDVFIEIRILLEGGLLCITVINPMSEEAQPPNGSGFGLQGIKRRLYLLYGRTDLLETSKTDGFFTTVLKIPQTATYN